MSIPHLATYANSYPRIGETVCKDGVPIGTVAEVHGDYFKMRLYDGTFLAAFWCGPKGLNRALSWLSKGSATEVTG
jgi:hypothetical protein